MSQCKPSFHNTVAVGAGLVPLHQSHVLVNHPGLGWSSPMDTLLSLNKLLLGMWLLLGMCLLPGMWLLPTACGTNSSSDCCSCQEVLYRCLGPCSDLPE